MFKKLRWASARLAVKLGADLRLRTPDRQMLEQVIFPYFSRDILFQRILFVGCDWYTKGYARIFSHKEYWTMEPNRSLRRFGAPRHIEDFCQNAPGHFRAAALDAIFVNGVFGYGLDSREDMETTIAGFRTCLRAGGVLVLGWNDIPERRLIQLEDLDSLKSFAPLVFPPLGSARHLTATRNRHTFSFFIR